MTLWRWQPSESSESNEDNEFNEDNETPEAIVAHYNACGYTPDNVPTNTERLPGTDNFVPKAEIAEIYWATNTWAVWPKQ